jgi:phage tail tape-measure protein
LKQKREDFFEQLKSQLDSWNEQLAGLEEDVEKLSSSIKDNYKEQLEEFKKNSQKAKEVLEEINKASSKSIEALIEGIDKAWQEMEKAFSDQKKE